MLGLTSLSATALLLFRLPITETGLPLLDAWARSGHDNNNKSSPLPPRDDSFYDGGGGGGGDDDDDNAMASGSGFGAGADADARGPTSGLGALNQMRQRRRRTNSLTYEVPKTPLERYLPYLNIGLCVILVLSGFSAGQGGGGGGGGEEGEGGYHHQIQSGWLGLGNLPAIVYGVVIIAKVVMASVDPERELTALKYEFKGA